MKKNKKIISLVLAAFMLVTVLTVSVSARYGMGGAEVGTKGSGAIWNDQNSPHTLHGDTTAKSGYSGVGIRVGIGYRDASGYAGSVYSPSLTTYKESTGSYVTDSVSIPSSYTPVTGYGYYKVDGTTASSSRAWNFG